jgi:hypothetical protein
VLVDVRQLERPVRRGRALHEADADAGSASPLVRFHEYPQHRRVEELDAAQIDDDLIQLRYAHHVLDRAGQERARRAVQLARQRNPDDRPASVSLDSRGSHCHEARRRVNGC